MCVMSSDVGQTGAGGGRTLREIKWPFFISSSALRGILHQGSFGVEAESLLTMAGGLFHVCPALSQIS